MLGDKAYELIKDLERSTQAIAPYDDHGVRQVLQEIKAIFDENCAQAANYSTSGDRTLWPLLNFRHAAIQRNKRCLLAYLYQRLQKIRTLRWEFGSVIPDDIRDSLSEQEINYFNTYSISLSKYMRSIGDGAGVDLTTNLRPPKSLYVEVRCIEDYGKFELEDGETINLKKNSQHYLPRSEVESLIRQGILQHITG